MRTTKQIATLQAMADANDGHCDRCGRVIQIYRYTVNKPVALMLRAMGKVVRETGVNKVNFDAVAGAYSLKTQRTKMRLHGLIAHHKEAGENVANTWVITKRGWSWLHGDPIMSKVVVFDNQVLGHEGEPITIYAVMHSSPSKTEPKFKAEAVSPPEAETYHDVRTPQKYLSQRAKYRGAAYSNLVPNRTYELQLKRLQVGRPVEVIGVNGRPVDLTYRDIIAFKRTWKIV